MSNKYNLLGIILFIVIYLGQSQSTTVDSSESFSDGVTTIASTSDHMNTIESANNVITTSESNTISSSTVSNPSTGHDSTIISTITGATGNSASIVASTLITNTYSSSIGMSSNTVLSSTNNNLSSTVLMASQTSISSTSITSVVTLPLTRINITEIYRFIVGSDVPLLTGNITDPTVQQDVQNMVNASFNLTDFNITVIRIEIRDRAKDFAIFNNKNFYSLTNRADPAYQYNMLVETWFSTSRTNCNLTCIDNAKSTSALVASITLLGTNNTLVNVSLESGPLPETDTTSVILPSGESPPGRAAQLGMGLGISIIGVLLIAEVIFLYRKYGLPNSARRDNYGVSMSNIR